MHNFKKMLHCVKLDYHDWIINSRLIIIAILIIFNYSFAVEPLIERSIRMGEKINILESFVAVGSSGMISFILPVVFYILISDFPADKGNAVFRISRLGRKNWLTAQFINLAVFIVTFLIIVALGTIFPIIGHCTVSQKWSPVVTDYANVFPESARSYELLPENLYYHVKNPLTAALLTYTLLFLYLFLIGEILILASVLNRRKLGNIISAFLIIGGAALCSVDSQWKWLFPEQHSIVWVHFTKFLRKDVVPLYVSYLFFAVSGTVLCIISFRVIKRYNFAGQEE